MQPLQVCMIAATVLLVLQLLLLLLFLLCLRCVVFILKYIFTKNRPTQNKPCVGLFFGCSAVDSTACQLAIVS
jgi:hypothetical protein